MIKIFFCFLILLSCTSTPKKTETDRLNAFFEEVFEDQVSRYPTWQTYLGRKTNYGQLDDETEAKSEEEHEITKKNLQKLTSFDFESLTPSGKTSYEIFRYGLRMDIEGYQWRYHSYPINQMFGYQSGTPSFLINMHQVEKEEDALAYISRLKEIQRVFSERLVFLKKQEKMGIIPPRFVFPKAIADSHNIITGRPFQKSAKASPLLEDFEKKVRELKLPAESEKKLLAAAKDALLSSVSPAYLELIDYLKKLEAKSAGNRGAWFLPEGKAFYEYKLKSSTTTALDANTIHETGLSEVKRIQKEMILIMRKVGFKGTLKEFFQHIRGKNFHYPDTEVGRKSYLSHVDRVLEEIKTRLPELFRTIPKAELLIKPVEAFREKSAGTAFYSSPSLEGNRPGIYYVNLYKMADNPRYKLEALAYHEAIPGHHFQISIANELEGLPKFRRTGGFTAYIEGWGLYAERLPKEIGLYIDSYSDFGRLSMEIWRSARLVVDTGIHAKRWSRERAINYMRENTPVAELESIKEIERYFVMPGQATSYKIGMMRIMDLRERARKELGEKFDIREFHETVLKEGALPLEILDSKVNDWIKDVKQN